MEIFPGKSQNCWMEPLGEPLQQGAEVEHQEVENQEHWKGREGEVPLEPGEGPLEEAEGILVLCGCECGYARVLMGEDF